MIYGMLLPYSHVSQFLGQSAPNRNATVFQHCSSEPSSVGTDGASVS